MDDSMKLHENKKEYLDLIMASSQFLEISENLVEKDYWVSYVLKRINESEFSKDIVFKGGTSLSKSYNVIERFSEDIDLHLFGVEEYGDSQRKKLFKNIEKVIVKDDNLNYIKGHNNETKHGNIRKTVYEYPKLIEKSEYGQASDLILLEISNMSNPSPVKNRPVSNFIYQYLREHDHKNEISEFELKPFKMKVLEYKRTFVEKLFAILDKTMQENIYDGLKKYLRHIYDLYKLYQEDEIKNFINNEKKRNKMFNKVIEENDFFGNRVGYEYSKSCLVDDCKKIMKKIQDEYENNFKILVYGELPKFDDVVFVLKTMVNFVAEWEQDNRKYYKKH